MDFDQWFDTNGYSEEHRAIFRIVWESAQSNEERYKNELNEYDKALRCEGWPFEARIERARMLAAGVDKLAGKS